MMENNQNNTTKSIMEAVVRKAINTVLDEYAGYYYERENMENECYATILSCILNSSNPINNVYAYSRKIAESIILNSVKY